MTESQPEFHKKQETDKAWRAVLFQFGGLERSDTTIRIPVIHNDVIVWGGPARLRYHGVAPLKGSSHPLLGCYRYNLTFRKAG